MAKKRMGRPPSGKPREFVRLPESMWKAIRNLAEENKRTKDLQIEAMLESCIKGYRS